MHQTFSFDSFDIDQERNQITFHYSVDNEIFFDPILEVDLSSVKNISLLHTAVFNLGMAEIPSFYKAVCTPVISIKAGALSPEQIKFWHNLYRKGLGEFFYRNNIDFRNLIHIKAEAGCTPFVIQPNASSRSEKYLVPMGGGKDSIVTCELLKAQNKDFTWFMLEPWPACEKVIAASGNAKVISMRRNPATYFAKIIELNKQGFYNGHVPITSVYTFSAVLAAQIHGFSHIIFSNERSANSGNVEYLGEEINHQYSKSFEFEQSCHNYIQKYVSPNVYVFSLLRHLYEIQIAQKFIDYPKYFQHFLSCNKGLKQATGSTATHAAWCGACAKCAFVYVLLSAFLEPQKVQTIFGKNLFEDTSLLPLFEELLGLRNIKPFDCVGIPEEVWLALYLAKKQYEKANLPLPILLKNIDADRGQQYLALLQAKTPEHLIPKNLLSDV